MADENKLVRDTTQVQNAQTMGNNTAQNSATQTQTTTQRTTQTIVPNTNAQQLNTIYQQNVGRSPDAQGQSYWLDQVNNGNLTMEQARAQIANSPEAQQYRQNQQTPQLNYNGSPVGTLEGQVSPMLPNYNYSGQAVTPGQYNAPKYNPTGMYAPGAVEAYNQQREQGVRDLYDMARENSLASLRTAYDQNMSNAQAALDRISPQYQEAMNQQAATNAVQSRNLNMQANANGLNTGAGSQMQLGQSIANQQAQGNLRRSEQEAINEAQRNIQDLQTNYSNQVAEAIAQNNYQLAAALMSEYENAYNRQMDIENTNYQRAQAEDDRAYERWMNDYNIRRQAENDMYNRANDDYARQLQMYQLQNEQNRQALEDARYAEENAYNRAVDDRNRQFQNLQWNYNVNRDAITDAQNAENQAYNRGVYTNETEYSRANEQAAQRAQYGDFSGYAQLYGDDVARQMSTLWEYQNPLLAYNLGRIDADRYFSLTGQMPYGMEGVEGEGGGYGGYYGGGGSGGSGSNGNGSRITWDNVMDASRKGYTMDQIMAAADEEAKDAVREKQTIAPVGGQRSVGGATRATAGTPAPSTSNDTGNAGFWDRTWSNLQSIFGGG